MVVLLSLHTDRNPREGERLVSAPNRIPQLVLATTSSSSSTDFMWNERLRTRNQCKFKTIYILHREMAWNHVLFRSFFLQQENLFPSW
mmetsp:Transcript_4909/g.14190  ORF Transcript_4909/g.14190 Transcript_4909/m.14190 type:complete len:88 (+) Transcript_4909:195-458(+)